MKFKENKMGQAIHQFLAGYSSGDAISNEARLMRATFRSWGYDSNLFCERRRVLPELAGEVTDVNSAHEVVHSDDIVLLHLSIGSVVNDVFKTLSCRKAILYHNMTPPEYLMGIQEEVARKLAWGREQAKELAGEAYVVMADSRYNAEELMEMGYKDVCVLPLFLDFTLIRSAPDRKTLRFLQDGKVNVLFVGRCVPNKKIEDLLLAFHYFQKFVEPDSRLIHVGSWSGMERYHILLLAQAQNLDLRDVVFMGSVPQAELSACYEAADLFLCMSEHEGFCIPLLESMAHDVPALAYAAAAVPETMGGAGVLFREKRFDMISEMMLAVVRKPGFRKALILGQRERLSVYEKRDLAAELKSHLLH